MSSAEPTSFDAFLPADVATLSVKDASGERETGWSIVFAGPSHPAAVAWAEEAARKRLRRSQQIEATRLNGKKVKPEDASPEDRMSENIGWVVSHIVDWTPVSIGGQTMPFSAAVAQDLLRRPEMGFVLAQAAEFLAGVENFTTGSAKP